MGLRKVQSLIILLISIASIASCSSRKGPVTSVQGESGSFNLDSGRYAVLNYGEDWYGIFKNVSSSSLTTFEMNLIEGIIDKCIDKHNRQFDERSESKKYFAVSKEDMFRQYVPVISKSGEKVVWVNFLCTPGDADRWRSEMVYVDDGGNCYFNLKVNLTQKTCYDLWVNGYA